MTLEEMATTHGVQAAEERCSQELFRYPSNRRLVAGKTAKEHQISSDQQSAYITLFVHAWDAWQQEYDITHCGFINFRVLPAIEKAGRAGQELSTADAVDHALAHPNASWPPPTEDRQVLIEAVDRRIRTLFTGYRSLTPPALVRLNTDTGSEETLWGQAVSAEARHVTIHWFNGTITTEPFWKLHHITLPERMELEHKGMLPVQQSES